jgi:transcriptional regulator with XRE-family HTH domain
VKVRNQKYLNAFGEHLAKLLNQKGKTPEEVAAHAGIETKQVYRVINGEHSATISITYAIAKGLGVHPKTLFDFEFSEH